MLELGKSDDIQQFVDEYQVNLEDNGTLVKMSPPLDSLSVENFQMSSSKTPNLAKDKTLLTNLSIVTSRISDFESCVSSSDDTGDDMKGEYNEEQGFTTMNNRKRKYKQRRKDSTTPSKEEFLKKQNTNPSPKSQS